MATAGDGDGNWTHSQWHDEFTSESVRVLSVPALRPAQKEYRAVTPVLHVRATGSKLEIFVNCDTYLGMGEVMVDWATDQTGLTTQSLKVSKEGKSFFFNYPEDVLGKLKGAKFLKVRVRPSFTGNTSATFDLSGLSQALSSARNR